ncbi:MAG: tetratricopeptide repeat protein [Candidatus Hydrogenedentes bacterium]|nr:tetratricopeptide repeat protein [Candidatus Hydrogenedentota bacterium]
MLNTANCSSKSCNINGDSKSILSHLLNILKNPRSTCPTWNGFLIALIIIVFSKSVYFEFVHYDDHTYTISKSNKGKFYSLSFIKWAFTSTDDGLWAPLTKFSHQIDTNLFGENASWHHAINIILHTINCILLWKFLTMLIGEGFTTFLSTAIFAIHPLRVEPVCWIASRKDLLSTFFLLLMLIEFLKYISSGKHFHYLFAVLYYFLSALSKPVAMVFPLFLPLTWLLSKRGTKNTSRITLLLLKSAPFFIIAFVLMLITIYSEERAIVPREFLSISDRALGSIISLGHYLLLTFVPVELHIPFGIDYYLFSGQKFGEPVFKNITYALYFGLVFFIFSSIWVLFTGNIKAGLVTLLMFLVPLLPVAGFVPFGHHLIADRFTYPSHIAFSLWLTTISQTKNKIFKISYNTFLTLILITYAIESYHLSSYWQNSETLFRRTLKFEPNSYVGLCNLASSFLRKNRYYEAIPILQKTIELYPQRAEPYNDLAYAYQRLGRFKEALNFYMKSIRLKPNDAEVISNISALFLETGDLNNAKKFAQNALKINPHLENAKKILKLIETQENFPKD